MSDEKVKYQGAVYHNRVGTTLLKYCINTEISRKAYTHAGAHTTKEYHDKRSRHLQVRSSIHRMDTFNFCDLTCSVIIHSFCSAAATMLKIKINTLKRRVQSYLRWLFIVCDPAQLRGQDGEGGDNSTSRIFCLSIRSSFCRESVFLKVCLLFSLSQSRFYCLRMRGWRKSGERSTQAAAW